MIVKKSNYAIINQNKSRQNHKIRKLMAPTKSFHFIQDFRCLKNVTHFHKFSINLPYFYDFAKIYFVNSLTYVI